MIRYPWLLAGVALLCAARAESMAAPGPIYTWTDADGLVHFSDAPPPANPDPDETRLPLDENTPIPRTLADLPLAAEPQDAAPNIRTDAVLEGAAIGMQSAAADGAGALSLADPAPDVPSSGMLSPEQLDALDPVWFREGRGDPAAPPTMFFDDYGPYTIGDPVEDVPVPAPIRCAAARRDQAVLQESWPIYRDQGGRLRHQWARDPYRGPRRYLDEAARSSALADLRQRLERDCPPITPPGAEEDALRQLLRDALCEAEQAELAALTSLGGDAPEARLADKRALAAEICGSPPPAGHRADGRTP